MHDADVDTDEDTPLACTVSLESKVGRWRGAYYFCERALGSTYARTRGDGGPRVHTRKAKATALASRKGVARALWALHVPMLLCHGSCRCCFAKRAPRSSIEFQAIKLARCFAPPPARHCDRAVYDPRTVQSKAWRSPAPAFTAPLRWTLMRQIADEHEAQTLMRLLSEAPL